MLRLSLLSLTTCLAMDYETYSSLKLNTPFEAKSRSKFDSGMANPNRGPDSENRARGWQAIWAVVDLLSHPLPPVAHPRSGAPRGTLTSFLSWTMSSVYPATKRDWWHYVPAQYDDSRPANLIVFGDGGGFMDPGGTFRATVVLDNLIADGLLPPTIAVFLNPGIRPKHPDCAYSLTDPSLEVGDDPQRSLEYDTVSERHSRFVLEEILPALERNFSISQDPGKRAVVGMSSSAVAAFCMAWFNPSKFGLVATFVGSFANIRGAHHLPWVIRNNPKKQLRVSLQSSQRDMDNSHGSWLLGNKDMAAALEYAGYEHKLDLGPGSHYSSSYAGSTFAETLLWIFRVDPSSCKSCHAERGGALSTIGRLLFWLCDDAKAHAEL